MMFSAISSKHSVVSFLQSPPSRKVAPASETRCEYFPVRSAPPLTASCSCVAVRVLGQAIHGQPEKSFTLFSHGSARFRRQVPPHARAQWGEQASCSALYGRG